MGYSMGPSKHAVYTNPIQAAECIGGIGLCLRVMKPHSPDVPAPPPADLDCSVRGSDLWMQRASVWTSEQKTLLQLARGEHNTPSALHAAPLDQGVWVTGLSVSVLFYVSF